MQIRMSQAAALFAAATMSWSGAEAATADRFATEAQRRQMACLQATTPATLEAAARPDGAPHFFRARLVFKAGEAEPAVEWLWKTDDAAAARLATYLKAYRMPCLAAGEGSSAGVQEFWLAPGTGQLEAETFWPTAAPGQPRKPSCYNKPEGGIALSQHPSERSKVLLAFRFVTADDPPEVEIVHRTGAAIYASDTRRYVRRYTPCAEGRTTLGVWHEQVYEYVPHGTTRTPLKPLDLAEFLAKVKGAKSMRARFDTRTMNCPFQVRMELRQPALLNSASSVGPGNANRLPFLAWLQRLQMDVPADQEASLFAEPLTISVPCQMLELT